MILAFNPGILLKGFIYLVCLALLIWFMIYWIKNSNEDATGLIIRWCATALIVIFMITGAVTARDPFAQIAMILVGAVCGLVLAVLWVPTFCSWVAMPFMGLYTGGDTQYEPRPAYSIAEARRNRGKYREAVAEVRKQLEKFPFDLQGHLLLAEILAEHLNDLPGACMSIEQWLGQPELSPANASVALNRLADFHLRYGLDPVAARQALERIVQAAPESEPARQAAQRIAHLATPAMLAEKHDRPKIAMRQGVQNIGLRTDTAGLRPQEADQADEAGKLIAHLNEFPGDAEAREKLALLYANHFNRLDLAMDQLEEMIAMPNQPVKQVAHWLNVVADLNVKISGDLAAAELAMQRIMERFPGTAHADNARQRLAYLKVELRGQKKSQAVRLGSAESNS